MYSDRLLTPHIKLHEIYCTGKHCPFHDRYNIETIISRMMPILWALETIRAGLNGRHETDSIRIILSRGWSCADRHEQIYKDLGLPVNWDSCHMFRPGRNYPCATDFEAVDVKEAIPQKTLHEEIYYDLRDSWPAGFHRYDWGFHLDTADGGKRRW